MFKRKQQPDPIETGYVSPAGDEPGVSPTLRYERGGGVYAMDGKVGTVRQVLVDESAGVVLALIVDIDKTNVTIMVPPDAIIKTGGSAVYLTGTRQQFVDWMANAPRYHPQMVAKANVRKLLKERGAFGTDPRRTIVRAGQGFVETGVAEPSAAIR